MPKLIEIPDGVNYSNYDMPYFVLDAIASGKTIPDNATNGDIIKAMFPNCKIILDNEGLIGLRPIGEVWIVWFTQSWWNAPYKAESEE